MRRLSLLFLFVAFFASPLWAGVDVHISTDTYPSPYLSDWETRTDMIQIELQNTGTKSVTVKLFAEIIGQRQGTILSGWGKPLALPPGDVRIIASDEMVDYNSVDYNASLKSQILSTGRIPQDVYRLHVVAYEFQDGMTGANLGEDEVEVRVLGFEQPVLLSPDNEEVVQFRQIPFEWQAATDFPSVTVIYVLRIFEIREGQSPVDASQSNRVFFEREIENQTAFLYPDDAPDLTPGQKYVWYVQAQDEQGNPLGENEGKSDLFTFWYKFGGGSGIASQLQRIVLDPAMGYLQDLTGLQITQNGGTYTLNGPATLILNGLAGSPALQAGLEDLQLDLTDPENPSILGGAVVVDAPDPADLGVDLGNLPIEFTDLRFSTTDGFTVGLKISSQLTDHPVPFEGRLELTPEGPHGQISLGESNSDTPVFSLGENPVQLQITQMSVHFSDPQVTAQGKLALFGQQVPCDLGTISFASGHLTSLVNCTPNVDIPLVDGSDLLTLHLGSLSGPVAFNLTSGTGTYDFTISGKTNFKLSGNTVGADVTLEVKPNDVQLKEFHPNAAISNFPIDLGWLKLALGNLDLTKLTWSGGKWDFNFGLNLNLSFPQFPNLNLPTLQNVTLGEGGFHLPSLSLPNLNLPSFNFGGFGISIKGFSMPDVTFPWFSGGGGSGFDWGFHLSLDLGLPNLPGNFPDCLKNPNISVSDVALTAEGLQGQIQGQALQNCEIPLGSGALVIQEISGAFNAGGDSQLGIRAQLRLPDELQCQQSTSLSDLNLQLKPNGIILGQVQNLAPSCPFKLGPFSFQITQADLNFSEKNSVQSAVLNMEGQLKLPGVQQGQQVTTAGVLKYDLAQNKLLDGQIEVNQPFRLDIPTEDPFLSFEISHALLDTSGLHISGSSQLKVGSETIPVNFQDLVYDPLHSAIAGGSIQFSQSFSVKVGLQNGSLTWGVVPFQQELSDPAALRLDLAGNISLDASGLHASGSSTGSLRFNGKDLATLGVNFQDFSVALAPVHVSTGSAKLSYNGVNVGELNTSGFVPDFGFFADAVLPDQLPLPVAQVAYVQLRQNNQLLVDVSQTNQGFSVKTRAGQPVKLVFPAFAANGGTPPELDVEFEIVLNTSNLSWVSGSIQVTDANLDLTSLGLPFVFNNLTYDGTAFSFGGVLSLLGQQFSGISLSLGSDNHLRGSINLPADFNFDLAANLVGIHLTSISSNFDADLSGLPQFQILANGDLNFNLQQGSPCSTPITLAVGPNGFSVQNFNLSCNALNFDYGWVKFGLSNLAFQSISWDANSGWDFACSLSMKLGFPEWGIQLPDIQNVGWNKNGFQFPDVDFPDLQNLIPAFDFSGFRLQPLAFRMPHIQIPLPGSSGGMPNDWGFHFDFSMSMPNLPASFPSCLRATDLTILDASFQDGKLNASVEAKLIQSPGCPIPLGAATLTIQSLSGGFSVEGGQQKGYVDFTAKLTLPEGLACENSGDIDLGQTHLRITGDGLITGDIQNILPSCPLTFGPFAFTSNQSALHFSAPNQHQHIVLDLGGSLQLPAPNGGHVTASGTLSYDLMQNKFLNGQMEINQPFVWNLPQENPVFSFVVQHAVLDTSGLVLDGGGSLSLGSGKSVSVAFNSLGLSFPDMKPKTGTATFSSNFALLISNGSDGLTWGVVDTNATMTGDFGVLFTLPQVSIVNGKLSVSGTGSAKIRYNGQPHMGLHVNFSDDFAMDWKPFGVKAGKADFYLDQDLLATVSSEGFLPGAGLLNLLPLPGKLPLPDSTIAYLEIKDASGHLRITTQQVEGGYQISGNDIPLVVPALAHNGTTPQWNITVSAVINPTDWSLVSGSIGVSAPPNQSLLDLSNLGFPLELKALDYGNVNGHPQLMLSAKLSLPQALNGADLRLDSLVVSNSGISGSAHLLPGQGQQFLLSQSLGSAATVNFKEVSATFSPFSCTVKGNVTSDVFGNSPITFTGALTTSSFTLQADMSNVGVLPLGIAQFQPQNIGGNPAISFTVGNTFQMVLNGIFKIPDLNNMELTVQQLSIGSGGVTVGSMDISGNPQSFNLFGSQFQINSLAFSYENSVFFATLGGTFNFMEQSITFSGLKIGSDGSFTAPSAVYNGNLVIVDPYLKIKQIGFAGDSLSVSGEATLPDPLVDTPQPFQFSVGKHGFSGSATITLIKETPQLGGGDQTELEFGGVGTLDVTYLALNLDFGHFRDSEIRGVFDFYIENDAQKRISIGQNNGSSVSPGVSVDFNGQVNWGSVQFAQNMSFDYSGFNLTLTSLTLTGGSNFELRLSGNMGINLPSVGGSLGFQNWGFSKNGVIIGSINEGSFTVTDLVTIQVNSISYSGTPTTISLDRMQESSGNNAPQKQSASINVNWYFSMGASLTINNVGGGGIDQFLIFEDTSNNISFILKHAHLELAGTMQVQLDLEYLTLNNGFKIGIAGGGTFGTGPAAVTVGAAGKIAMFNGQPSFGLFAMVGGQIKVPIGPGIVMTGFGGGFFYHPDTHDLQIVKTLCGMSDTGGKIHDPGSFAVFLFGTAAIVDDYVMKGSALVTLSSNFFSLDAKVILLNMGDSLTGKLNLTFGISSAYVEGNVEVDLKISSLLTGKQQISFFFYGTDAWAVNGSLQINVLSFVTVNGGLYVGPPGFLVEMSISKKFDIVIVSVSAGMDGSIWYQQGVSWGGYFKAYISASIAGGVATAKGWMEFAVLNTNQFYIYGAAGLHVSVLFVIDWTGSVWAKIEGGGHVSGGFGSDPEMEKLINDAKQSAEDMQNAKDEAQSAMDQAKANASNLSPEELANAGAAWITQYSMGQKQQIVQQVEPNESQYSYFRNIYSSVVSSGLDDLPNRVGREQGLATIRQDVDAKISDLSSAITNVQGQLGQIQVTVPDLQTVGGISLGGSPLSGVVILSDNEHLSKAQVENMGFDLDAQAAANQQQTLAENESQMANLDEQIHQQISSIWQQLNQVGHILENSTNNIGLKNQALITEMFLYYDMAITLEKDLFFQYNQNIAQLNQIYNAHYSLTAAGIQVVNGNFVNLVQGEATLLSTNQNELKQVTLKRKQKALQMAYFGNQQEYQSKWQAAQSNINSLSGNDLKQANINAGIELWKSAPLNGNQKLRDLALAKRDSILEEYEQKIQGVHTMMSQVEAPIDSLYKIKARLTEVLYDLYDQLRQRNQTIVQSVENLPSANIGTNIHPVTNQAWFAGKVALLQTVNQTREQAEKMLHVPQVTNVSVATYRGPYFGSIFATFGATHADKVVEYSYQIQRAGHSVDPSAWNSLGLKTSFHYFFTNHQSGGHVLYIRARGSGGYTNTRYTSFYINAGSWGSNVSFQSQGTSEMTSDHTPPTTPVVKIPSYSASHSQIHARWESMDEESGVTEYLYAVYKFNGSATQFKSKYPNALPKEPSSPGSASALSSQFLAGLGGALASGAGGQIQQTGSLAGQANPGATQVIGTGLIQNEEDLQNMFENNWMDIPIGAVTNYASEWLKIQDWKSAQGRTEVIIRHLELEDNTIYRVAVKARNGDHQMSAVGYSNALLIDQTPPVKPQVLQLASTLRQVLYLAGGQNPNAPAVYKAGINASWSKGNDGQSGIWDYQIAFSSHPLDSWSPQAFIDNAVQRSGTFFNDSIGFVDTVYVNVVAVNGAGTPSDVRHLPIVIHDPTPPTRPKITVPNFVPSTNRLFITVTKPSVDPESGVDHYQIRIRSYYGGQQILPWTNEGDLPPAPSQYSLQPYSPAGLVSLGTVQKIIKVFGLNMENGRTYYVNVRAVNRDGTHGQAWSKFFKPDATPPVLGSANVQYFSYDNTIQFDLGQPVEDPESGIDKVVLSVGTSQGNHNVLQAVEDHLPSGNIHIIRHKRLEPGRDYFAQIRVINGSGKETKREFTVHSPDLTRPVIHLNQVPSYVTPQTLNVQGSASDPESGITDLAYQIVRGSHGMPISRGWISVGLQSRSVTTQGGLKSGTLRFHLNNFESYNFRHGQSYRVYLRAKNGDNLTTTTLTSLITVLTHVPGRPMGLQFVQTSRDRFRISWNPAAASDAISHYEFALTSSSNAIPKQWSRTRGIVSSVAPNRNVPVGTRFYAWMRAVDRLGQNGEPGVSQPVVVSYMDSAPPSIAWLHLNLIPVLGQRRSVTIRANWSDSDRGSGIASEELELWGVRERGAAQKLAQGTYQSSGVKRLGTRMASSSKHYDFQNVRTSADITMFRVKLTVTDKAGNVSTRWVQK